MLCSLKSGYNDVSLLLVPMSFIKLSIASGDHHKLKKKMVEWEGPKLKNKSVTTTAVAAVVMAHSAITIHHERFELGAASAATTTNVLYVSFHTNTSTKTKTISLS